MSHQPVYRVNSPTVINETIEGESIIINLQDGFYYSLDNVGSVIWEAINRKNTVASILENAKKYFEGDAAEIKTGILELIEAFEKEQLIVPISPSEAVHSLIQSSPAKIPFVKPKLQKFSDMQDLLLLDPIHEVDEKGWPFSNKENTQE